MIAVCGTSLSATDLPDNKFISYKIVSQAGLNIFLRTLANNPACTKIYAKSNMVGVFPHDLMSKVVEFNDDTDLVVKLGGVPDAGETSKVSVDSNVTGKENKGIVRKENIKSVAIKTQPISSKPVTKATDTDVFTAIADSKPIVTDNSNSLFEDIEGSTNAEVLNDIISEDPFADVEERLDKEATTQSELSEVVKNNNEDNVVVPEDEIKTDGSKSIEEIESVVKDIKVAEFESDEDDNPAIKDSEIEVQTEDEDDNPAISDFESEDNSVEEDVDEADSAEDIAVIDTSERKRSKTKVVSNVKHTMVEQVQKQDTEDVDEKKVKSESVVERIETTNVTTQVGSRPIKKIASFKPVKKVSSLGITRAKEESSDSVDSVKVPKEVQNPETLAAYQELMSAKDARISELLNTINEMSTMRSTVTNEQVEGLKKRMSDLESSLNEKDKMIEAQTDILNKRKSENEQLREQLKSVVEKTQGQGSMTEMQINQYKQRITDLASKLTTYEVNYKKVATLYAEQKQAYDELLKKQQTDSISKEEVEELVQQVNALKSKVSDKEFQLKSAYDELNAHDKKNAETIADKDAMIIDLQSKATELEMYKSGELVMEGPLTYYDGFTSNVQALLNVPFKDEVLENLQGVDMKKVFVMSFGAWTSIEAAMKDIKGSLFTDGELVVLDLMLDVMLVGICKGINPINKSYLDLANPGFNIASVAKSVDNVDYISCGVKHDIGFLTLDWGILLQNLQNFANGRRILILLPQLSSFNTSIVFSQLCLAGANGFYVVTGASYPLVQARTVLSYFPKKLFKTVLIDCNSLTDSTKNLMGIIAKNTTVLPFRDGMDFYKLGLMD